MEKYLDVMNGILDLSDTVVDGLKHIEKQLDEIRYEESFAMFYDVVEGISSIESSMNTFYDKLPENKLNVYMDEMKKEISLVITCYQNSEMKDFKTGIKSKVLPSYINWQNEIKRVFQS